MLTAVDPGPGQHAQRVLPGTLLRRPGDEPAQRSQSGRLAAEGDGPLPRARDDGRLRGRGLLFALPSGRATPGGRRRPDRSAGGMAALPTPLGAGPRGRALAQSARPLPGVLCAQQAGPGPLSKQALAHPAEPSGLFVSRDVYDHLLLFEHSISAYYGGHDQESLDACNALLARPLPPHIDAAVRRNLVFPQQRLARMAPAAPCEGEYDLSVSSPFHSKRFRRCGSARTSACCACASSNGRSCSDRCPVPVRA